MGKEHMSNDEWVGYKYHNEEGRLVYGHIQSIKTEAPFILVYRNQDTQLWVPVCSSHDYYYVAQEKLVVEERDGIRDIEIWATLKQEFGDGDYGL